MKYIKRTDYNNVISVKLVIPGGCNARCVFCYMKDQGKINCDKEYFLSNFISSLDTLINMVGEKNPVSLDITGNEPTFDVEFLKKVLNRLKEFNIKDKVSRVTITTNGFNLYKLVQYFQDVIDYVNISVHDFDLVRRTEIMGTQVLNKNEYYSCVEALSSIGIKTSAVAVIYKPINEFIEWANDFIRWCKSVKFVSLRFRCDVFWKGQYIFDEYMQQFLNDKGFAVINHENTPDSHWCRLRRYDGFRLFFLHGVLDTSIVTKGIEYVIAEDGLCYCDFYRKVALEDYEYEVGKIYDIDKWRLIRS